MTIHRTPANWITLLALLAASLMLAGCGDDDPISPNDTYATADEDAAGVVATEIATDNGGMTDQIADLSSAVGGLDVDKALPGPRFQNAVYDETTGTWTLTVERERGDSEGTPYAAISRVYTLRFLYIGGQPQQYRIVGSDTARTVEFNIVSGTGTHRTRRFEHALDVKQVRHERLEVPFEFQEPAADQGEQVMVARRRPLLPEPLPACLIGTQGESPGRHDEGPLLDLFDPATQHMDQP